MDWAKGRKATKAMLAGANGRFSPEILAWYKETLRHFGSDQVEKSLTDTDVLCPVHGDHNPSLGADLRQNGAGPKIVLNCRSQGCEYSEILDSVGLKPEDLYYRAEDEPSLRRWRARTSRCALRTPSCEAR